MTELISAAEARRTINSFEVGLGKQAKEALISKICSALEVGSSECFVYGKYNMLQLAEKLALMQGYKVSLTDDQRNGAFLKVEW